MNTLFAQLFALLRFRPIITGCFALIVALSAANYFLWKERQRAAQEHDVARHTGESMLRALSNRTRIDTDLAAVQAAIAHIERNLLEEQSMEVNLGYFFKLEKSAQVRLVRLNQLSAPPSDSNRVFKAVPFSMQVTGSYRNTMNFLRSLETGSHILRIRNCSFERSSTDSGELVLNLMVDVLAKT